MASEAPPRDRERRQATVLYADISGFTALSEKLDPEDVTTVMNQVFDRLENVVVARGGIVNQYIGDCVMAVFGLGPADGRNNASRQAVQAAVEMRGAVYQFNDEGHAPSKLDIHIGVNTGPVIAGDVGGEVRREFTVMGDTVALAARLEDASTKGQIYVGPRTFADTADDFEYKPLEPITFKPDVPPAPIYELLAAKPRRRGAKRDSERRQATVLFADIAGFEVLSQHLSPEELSGLLNRCFGLLESIVRSYGGVVDKYIGECLMALFGVPNAIENAPRQAINAAIEIRNRLEQFSADERLPSPLQVHMGVNTGLVIAGEIGGRLKRDFTVMGDTVNLASRLKGAAGHGAIFVAPETYRYTKDAFEYHPPKDLTLSGKAQPVPTYELASSKQQVHRTKVATSDRMIFSELVGREREVERLQACLSRVVGGEGGIVSVVGEAGLGKSRLMAEVLRFEPLRQATVLEGRSTSIGQNLSFHPFIDLLRQWAGIGDDDADRASFQKLEAAIVALAPDAADEILPFVATLMGVRGDAYAERLQGIEGEALEKLIFKNTRDLFARIATGRPLVVVFEDLHWADLSSVNLLETLLRLVDDHPILFVNVFRPDHEDTSGRIRNAAVAAHASRHTEVRVEPLDARHAGRLVENLLKIEDLPPATRELITRKAEGNPFYIEEVVRSLIDQGAVELADGRFRVTAKIEAVVIPGTIQEVIMARVDRLDEPTRHLLQVASVIGRNFYYRIIAEIVRRQGEASEELDAELARLQEKQLLLQRAGGFGVAIGERSVAQDLEYIFAHALAQETVYESILQKTRKEFHQTVADAIEALFADRLPDFYGMLAHHYTRADNLVKAEEHLVNAGEEAARAAASREALNFFQEALRIYTKLHADGGDPHRRAMLEKNIGYAFLNSGQLTESISHFDSALEHNGYQVSKNTLRTQSLFLRDMLAVLYHLYLRPGARPNVPVSDRERELFAIMLRRFRAMTTSEPKRLFMDLMGTIRRLDQRDPATFGSAGEAYTMAGAAFAYSGTSFAIGRRFLSKAEPLIRPSEVSDVLGWGFLRFVINFLEGQWQEEPGLERDLLDRGLKNGIVWDVNSYLGLECDRRLRQARFAAAREQLERLTEVSDVYGYEFAKANYDGMRAILLLEERRLDEALDAVERYYAGREEDTLRVLALGTKAKTLALLGRHADARAALAQIADIRARAGLIPPWHLSAHLAAQLRHDLDTLETQPNGDGAARRAATKSARQALRIAKVAAGVRAETWRLVGRLHWLCGRPQKALAWWQKTIRECERLDAQGELARTCAEMAGRARTQGVTGVDVAANAERARTLFTEAGLAWDLAQMERALGPDADPTALRRF
jgi:class 3 adenylate cyclase/tetratricopeptide (TPR) repeat protein